MPSIAQPSCRIRQQAPQTIYLFPYLEYLTEFIDRVLSYPSNFETSLSVSSRVLGERRTVQLLGQVLEV